MLSFQKKNFIVGATDYKLLREINFSLFWGNYKPSQVIQVKLR